MTTLNASQMAAVTCDTYPILCLAGAGSGKTHTLTHRVARLVSEGVPPDQIAVMTFTRKAAAELQDRLQDLLGSGAVLAMTIGTIHSLCFRLLREVWAARQETWEIIAPDQQKRLVRDLLAPPSRTNPQGLNWAIEIRTALSTLSWFKNHLWSPADLDPGAWDPRWATLYAAYEAAMRAQHLIDLDDLLVETWRVLRDDPALRQRWHDQWAYLFVDECQDNSTAQWEILRLLAAPEHRVFYVGDDWQSIYGWRGARPDYLVHFQQYYPSGTILTLDLNYRSLPYIVDAGNTLIQRNLQQLPKTLRSARATDPQWTAPVVWTPSDDADEAAMVVRTVQTLHEADGRAYSDMAVLYRTNAQSAALEDALVRAKIPYRIVGSTGFWARREVKDLLAYAALTWDRQDEEAFRRILNVPSRYLGRAYLIAVTNWKELHGLDYVEALESCPAKPYQRRSAMQLAAVLRALQTLESPGDIIATARDLIDYDAWFLRDEAAEGDDADPLDTLRVLEDTAYRFHSLEDLLAHATMMQQRTQTDTGPADQVTLLTIHRAKGLEWPVVFGVGWVQGVLPFRRSLEDPDALEEERRLAYVAVTRARDQIYLSAPLVMRGRECDASQFLEEMALLDPVDGIA